MRKIVVIVMAAVCVWGQVKTQYRNKVAAAAAASSSQVVDTGAETPSASTQRDKVLADILGGKVRASGLLKPVMVRLFGDTIGDLARTLETDGEYFSQPGVGNVENAMQLLSRFFGRDANRVIVDDNFVQAMMVLAALIKANVRLTTQLAQVIKTVCEHRQKILLRGVSRDAEAKRVEAERLEALCDGVAEMGGLSRVGALADYADLPGFLRVVARQTQEQ